MLNRFNSLKVCNFFLNSFVYESINDSQNGRTRCQRPSWVET